MTKLTNKYVIGTHVMFFEIEMYEDFIDGMVNLLETVENKENVTIDLCFNLLQHFEKIDEDIVDEEYLTVQFFDGVRRIESLGYKVVANVVDGDEFYFHADYRRDLNYNYCKKVDYVIHCASYTNAEGSFLIKNKMYKNNINCMKNILKYCIKNKSKLFHISSTSVYGKQKKIVSESDDNILKPQSPYAKIKLIEEKILSTAHVRLTAVGRAFFSN